MSRPRAYLPLAVAMLFAALLAWPLQLSAQATKGSDTILDEAKVEVESITLILLQDGEVVGKMLGKSAENHADGGVQVSDATFLIYPQRKPDDDDDANAQLGTPSATIEAGQMLWYRARDEIILSKKAKIVWRNDVSALAQREMIISAESGTLTYKLADVAEDNQRAGATLAFKEAKEVVFNGLDLNIEAPLMDLSLVFDTLKDEEGASTRRVRSLGLVAPDGATIGFPESFIRVIGDRIEGTAAAHYQTKSGGRTTLDYAWQKGASSHPLKLKMKGRVRLSDVGSDHTIMRSTNLDVDALLAEQASADTPDRLSVQRMALEQSAQAELNEVSISGDQIIVDLERAFQRELIVRGGAKLSIEPKSAAGEVRIRDLDSVGMRAKREIRILETRDTSGESQESAISAFEEASAAFGMADGSAFRLRGNEVHFTLQRAISEAEAPERARYSLRNLSEFACFGSGVRPLLTWHEGEVRRFALFAESLLAERSSGDNVRIQAKGPRVRAAIVPTKTPGADQAGFGIASILAKAEYHLREIWLTATGGLQTTMPLSLLDPDLGETGATVIEMVAQREVHYEEIDESGKTFNAIQANGLTLTLTFGAREDSFSSREIENLELYLGRGSERSVRMGLGSDIIVCRTATIQIRNKVSKVTLSGDVETWWHSEALLAPLRAAFAGLSEGESGPVREADLLAIRTEFVVIEKSTSGAATRIINQKAIAIDLLDSGRVAWGLGNDALHEHDRTSGITPDVLATFRGGNLLVTRDDVSLHLVTPEAVAFKAKESVLDARSLDLVAYGSSKLTMTLSGPISFKARQRGLRLIVGAVRRGTSGVKDSEVPYSNGLTLTSDGPLRYTIAVVVPAALAGGPQVLRETTYSLGLSEPFIISAQEANDPLSNAEGRIDTLKAGSLDAVIMEVEAPESKPTGNVPSITEFRLGSQVDATFRGTNIKGDRLFYDRTSDRFVLGGIQVDTRAIGVEITGIERVEVSFPVLNQKLPEEEDVIEARREWRIVGERIKLRRTTPSKSPQAKESAHDER